METVKLQTSRATRNININNTLYTLVNGVTGHVDGNISIETHPSLNALFELNQIFEGEPAKPRRLESYGIKWSFDPSLS